LWGSSDQRWAGIGSRGRPAWPDARAARAAALTTLHIAAELAFDEAGIAIAVKPACLGQEGLEVLADDGVQDALLRFVAAVAVRQ
jgi:hypothetical protein